MFDCIWWGDVFRKTDLFPCFTTSCSPNILILLCSSYTLTTTQKTAGLPPGRATSPACVRNFIDRVVNATCKFPFLSPKSNIKTLALCLQVAAKLLSKSVSGQPGGNGALTPAAVYKFETCKDRFPMQRRVVY